MLIKREKTAQGLPLISFAQRAPYAGYPNLLLGEERPQDLETDPALPGVMFITQPVHLSVIRVANGTLLLRRLCSQREQEAQGLPVDGEAWPLGWIDGFTLDESVAAINGHPVPIVALRVTLAMGQRFVVARHTGEHPLGMRQLQGELERSVLPLRATPAPHTSPKPKPEPSPPPDPAPAAPADPGPVERLTGGEAATFPQAAPRPERGRGLPLLPILGGIFLVGLVIAGALGLQRHQEAQEAAARQAITEAPSKNYAAVVTTIGSAIDDALRPYCPDRACIRAKVREGADNSWEIVAAPAGLRLLLYAYLDPGTRAPMARLKMDLATIREDGDLAKSFPAMIPIVNQILAKLNFPKDFRNAACATPAMVGSTRYSCEASEYDPVYGAFDAIDQPAARLFRYNRAFTLLAHGPFQYDAYGDKILQLGP